MFITNHIKKAVRSVLPYKVMEVLRRPEPKRFTPPFYIILTINL